MGVGGTSADDTARPKVKKVKVPDPEKARVKALLREAELRLKLADADEAEHGAAIRQAEAEMSRIAADQAKRELDEANGSDARNHVYKFTGQVTPDSVKAAVYTLTVWSRMEPKCDITIVFNSPGGSLVDGMALFDHLSALKADGHKLTTVTRGMAASMASILFQVGDVRVMGAESYQLVHEVSFGAEGKPGEVDDRLKWIAKITARVLRIYAARSTMTEKQIAAKWKRTDWTLDADESVLLGFADCIG
jgi:ATP-dependent protease ClpP protease subunit